MRAHGNQMFGVKAATFVLAAMAAASAAYWGFKVSGTATTGHPAAMVAMPSAQPVDPLAVARALGGGETRAAAATEAAPSAGSRFALVGVISDTSSGGAALISVDGKPAKPFRVGASVDGRLVLQSVTGRKAALAAGTGAPAEVTLELPALAK